MCLMNGKPINCSPCIHCPEYLASCKPVVVEGFLGECDKSFCEWCGFYGECTNYYESEDFEYEIA